MLHIKRILYATDFSKSARQALPYALDMAVCFAARLDVIHVLQSKTPYPDEGRDPHNIDVRLREEVQGQLDVRYPGLSTSMEIHYAVLGRGRVSATIVDYAETFKVDLIVMGSHGRSGFSRFFASNVAEDVRRMATCPVITVRQNDEAASRADQIERILVPIDFFSMDSKGALRIAREIAAHYGAQLDLLHIINPNTRPEIYDTSLIWFRDVGIRLQETVRQQLETLFEETEGPVVATSTHAITGNSVEKIIDFAQANDAGLIVMAHRGLTGMERLMEESVTHYVLREALCPVLVTKPSDRVLLGPEAQPLRM